MSTKSTRTTSHTITNSHHPSTIKSHAITTPKPPNHTLSHHINNPPTSFRNPWPSSPPPKSLLSIIHLRFFDKSNRNFKPVPSDRRGLVDVRTPTWGGGDAPSNLKATWIGHASWLVEFPCAAGRARGVRVLLDPVFSQRMSPFTWLGPKRFTPPPCRLHELPHVDLVCISHNHYDHLDEVTVRYLSGRGRGTKFACGLGVGKELRRMGVNEEDVVELDWWGGVEIEVEGVGSVRAVCTPCQHGSGRWVNDHGCTLWCSWVLEGVGVGKKLFFAGDTAYRYVPKGTTEEELDKLPVCTAFAEVGDLYGPFDLALLPIGCFMPRHWMSAVHAAPEDSICIHKDVKSKKSLGMHYGVLRGGISQYYEDVLEPPRRWRESCEKAGLKWKDEIDLVDVGETCLV